MKKIYFLAVAVCAFAFNANAQIIEDDFEFYTLGDMGTQAPGIWTNWSQDPAGSPGENMIVTDAFASNGTKAGAVNVAGQDAILLLGNQTSGDYTLEWDMYVPSGQSGYFNIQGEIPSGALTGVFNSSDIYFNEANGTPGVGNDPNSGDFNFPHDAWFRVSIYADVDATEYTLTVDGVSQTPVAFQADATLGGIDFFFAGATNEYYVDQVLYVQGPLGVNDFSADVFSVYPNPVKDVLNISSKAAVDAVTVYDVLGKVVLQAQPDAISPSLDMSALSSGAYLVQVTIGDATKTIKVIK